MKTLHLKEAGFSAVELLITLFIAAAFLATGYQLYSIIIEDGGNARTQAKASNIAYDFLRRYTPNATNPCTPSTPSATIPAGSLPSPSSATVTISCPGTLGTNTVSKVQVTITYGSPAQQVIHAIFVTE